MRVEEVKNQIMPVLRKYGVKGASIFGSAVRGEVKESSDVHIPVEIDKNSLVDYVATKLELEEVLGRRVDLVEYDTVKARLG